MAKTRTRSKHTTPDRASVILLKPRDGLLESISAPWAANVAVPDNRYAAYLQSRSNQNGAPVESRWTITVRKRFYFCIDEDCWPYLVRQPGGWIVKRDHPDELYTPSQTLSTILDCLPVVFPRLKLAALVAESPELMKLASLRWQNEPVPETKSNELQTATD